ncbi:MAG: hypothetical protein AAGA90_06945 [Actinomycetota bacterium]
MANDTAVLDLTSASSGAITDAQLGELGWTLKPEGLCQDDTCVLVPDRAALVTDAGVDVATLGGLLDRPVVIDAESGVAAIGAPRSVRRSAVDDLRAPEFTLPDLEGGLTSLSDHRSKKRLLVAFSSW